LCGVLPVTGSSRPRARPTQVSRRTETWIAACGRKARDLSLALFLLRAMREIATGARRHQAARRTMPWAWGGGGGLK